MNRGKKMLAGLTALVLLLLMCAAAAADGRPGVYDIAFYARKGGKQLYVWQTDQNGKLTKELRSCYRTGLVFMGWYTHPYGGYRVTQDTVFTQDTNVWAHWGRIEGKESVPPTPGVYTISFEEDNHSRTLPSTVQTGEDGKIRDLPEPTVEKERDLKFMGWRNKATLEKVTADTVFTGEATLQAVWGSASKANLTYMSRGCIIRNNAYPSGKWLTSFAGKPDNGGGRQFLGWYTQEEGGEKASKILMTGDTVLYARWSDPGATITFADAVAFDGDGNQLPRNKLRTREDGTLEYIPGGLSRNRLFIEWYTDKRHAVPLTADTAFTRDSRVWAKVEPYTGIQVHLDVRKYGQYTSRVTPDVLPVKEDGTLEVIPVPQWSGNGLERRSFLGWFTEDEKPVTKETVFTADTTIHAKWVEGYKISFSSYAQPEYRAAWTDGSGKLAALPAIGKAYNGNPALGWYTADGKKVTGDTVFTADTELTAKWGFKVRFYTENRGNGWGYGDVALLTTDEDGKLPYLPKGVHAKGWPFDGWVDASGNAVTEDTVFTEDTKVFGTWETGGNLISLIGGKGGVPDVTSIRTRNDGTVSELPEAHHKNGLPFRGWSSTEDGKTPVTAETVFSEPVTKLYATWIPAWKVTFRAKGGEVAGGVKAVMTDEEGHVAEWPDAEHPLKLKFEGWYTSQRTDAEKEGPQSVFTKDTWVDARWSVPEVPAGGFTITLVDRDRSWEEHTTASGKLQFMSNLHRSDAVFYGWFMEPAAGGTKVRNGVQVGGDLTFHAAWLIPLTAETDW